MKRVSLLLGAVLLLAVCGCQEPNAPAGQDILQVNGTVRYDTLEGGFWAVHGDDGTIYDPLEGLATEFQKDGLRVWMEAKLRPDLASVHMVGPIVEVIRIKAL
jgi:hypothetical protein